MYTEQSYDHHRYKGMLNCYENLDFCEIKYIILRISFLKFSFYKLIQKSLTMLDVSQKLFVTKKIAFIVLFKNSKQNQYYFN